MLDDTLVVLMGEMGRTPKVNKSAGRDHWTQCGFIVYTGAGVRRATVFGRSDKQAGWPVDFPVSSADHVATMYKLVGVDPPGCRSSIAPAVSTVRLLTANRSAA
ncbi:MAG: hypothetical protein Ct9H300mP1_09690 [Planctomycetaceae bacterium]|nr:MAG: hypothetical protein Ct9H300mP1_09690 [Planctomycetaceae bacterium]